jgi:hypothetical protein
MLAVATIVRPLAALETVLSLYALYPSLVAIHNLRQYEPATKRAAKVSSTAADQLWTTRYTQSSGLVAVRPPALFPHLPVSLRHPRFLRVKNKS